MIIYKYELRLGLTIITVPRHCKFLDTQIQNGVLCMWALVDPNVETTNINVHVVGTGHPLAERFFDMKYNGTVQDGKFVWHVFLEGVK